MKMATKMEPRNETWAWRWSCTTKMGAVSWRRRCVGFRVQGHFSFHSKNL